MRAALAAVAVVAAAAPAAPAAARAPCPAGPFSAADQPPACWRPYSARSPFNRPLPRRPRLVADSDAMVARTLEMGPITGLVAGVADSPGDWTHPVYWARRGDPAYRVHCVRYRCHGIEGRRVRIPRGARPSGSADAHMAVIEPDGWEVDFWQARRPDGARHVVVAGSGGRTRIDGSGLSGRPNANAARWGLLAGVIRPAEIEAGEIDHALVVMVGCTRRVAVYPARGLAAGCDEDASDAPASGQRFWLDMSDDEIAALGAPPWKQAILRALAHYGAFVGDTGGNEALSFSFESGSSSTSFGLPDPLVAFAQANAVGLAPDDSYYDFDIASGVPWAERLRVVDPCVSRRRCGAG